MFLLNRDIFLWDLAILVLLAFGLGLAVAARVWLKKAGRRGLFHQILVGCIGITGFIGFVLTAYGSFIEPHLLFKTVYSVPFPMPAPLTIAVISDLHLGPYKNGRYLARAVEMSNAALPDIVILTGDYFFTSYAPSDELSPLKDLRAPLGVFAILGNHDTGRSRGLSMQGRPQQSRVEELTQAFKAMNITLLQNELTMLKTARGDVAIAGVDDMAFGNSDAGRALNGLGPDVPVILASHSPDVILDGRSRRAQLIVAGHTHGGQIRLPFIGPIGQIPTRLGQAFDQGLFTVDDDTTLAITRGIGESGVRSRLFAWPEVMIVETVSQN